MTASSHFLCSQGQMKRKVSKWNIRNSKQDQFTHIYFHNRYFVVACDLIAFMDLSEQEQLISNTHIQTRQDRKRHIDK